MYNNLIITVILGSLFYIQRLTKIQDKVSFSLIMIHFFLPIHLRIVYEIQDKAFSVNGTVWSQMFCLKCLYA